MPKLFLITFFGVFFAVSASATDDFVWQLRLNDGHPANCTLALTRVAIDDKGRFILEADSRSDKGVWHSCITLPKGLLKAGQDYVITFDYEVVERSAADSYFYVFCAFQQPGLRCRSVAKMERRIGRSRLGETSYFADRE